jgi:hypothetical protein
MRKIHTAKRPFRKYLKMASTVLPMGIIALLADDIKDKYAIKSKSDLAVGGCLEKYEENSWFWPACPDRDRLGSKCSTTLDQYNQPYILVECKRKENEKTKNVTTGYQIASESSTSCPTGGFVFCDLDTRRYRLPTDDEMSLSELNWCFYSKYTRVDLFGKCPSGL